MRPPPKLSIHKATGVYCVKHKGRRIYFCKDPGRASQEYAEWISNTWAPSVVVTPRRGHTEDRLLELSELYLTHVTRTRGERLARDYRCYLNHALNFGEGTAADLKVSNITAAFLSDLKASMLSASYKPRTVNHTLKCLIRMIRWAEDEGKIDGCNLPSRTRLVPVGKPQPKALPPGVVVQWLQQAREADERLVPWLALNYLAVMRPSEIPRLVRGEGEEISEGVWAIEGKSTHKTLAPRYVLLSTEARRWLAVAEPCWKRWESYSAQVRKTCKYGGPRQLRAWAATHLRHAGVALPDVRVALGHSDGGSVGHYVESDFSRVLKELDRISVLPVEP